MNVKAKAVTEDNVRIEQYDIDVIRRAFPHWDEYPKWFRHWFCKYEIEPVHIGTISNVTCDGLHEYLAKVLTFTTSDGNLIDEPGEIAFGDDATAFATTDTTMNNEVGSRINVTDPSATGKTFDVDEFLSSNEQNGNTLREVGLFSKGGVMYQHSATDQVYNKDNSFALIINISIPFSDAP